MFKRTLTLSILFAEDHSGDDAPEGAEQEFVLPENLADRETVTDEVLAELEATAMGAFDAIRTGRLTPEAIQTLSDLTDAIEAIRAEAATRIDAAAEDQARADALAERVHTAAIPDSPEGVEDGAPAAVEGDPEGGETPPAPEGGEAAPAAPAEGAPPVVAEGGDGGAPAPAPAAPAPVAVAAAAPPAPRPIRIPIGAIAAHAPAPAVEPAGNGGLAMVAAAELPGISPGTPMNSNLDIARAMHARARHLNNGHSAPIVSIERPLQHRISEQMNLDAVQAVIAAAIDVMGPQGLTAAGGWCAISQVLYDLFSMESTDGLFQMPTVGIERGGIQFPDPATVPTLQDVFGSDALWVWTEQNDIDAHTAGGSDPTKPCARIPCIDFTEERLSAEGICLTHGNLADQAYPELTRRYVDLVMAAHEHVMSIHRLAAVISGSSSVTMGSSFGAVSPVLGAIEVQALDIRDKYRMNMNVLLEAVFPHWIKGVLRADLGHRADSGADDLGVTDAQIEAWFVQRGVRPQFVYNWQSLQTSSDGDSDDSIVSDGGGENGESTQYPTTADFLIYPAATWLWGSGGQINLAVLRDSTLNATNDHTAAFTEEFHLVAKRGPESRKVTVALDPSGETGATDGAGAGF